MSKDEHQIACSGPAFTGVEEAQRSQQTGSDRTSGGSSLASLLPWTQEGERGPPQSPRTELLEATPLQGARPPHSSSAYMTSFQSHNNSSSQAASAFLYSQGTFKSRNLKTSPKMMQLESEMATAFQALEKVTSCL